MADFTDVMKAILAGGSTIAGGAFGGPGGAALVAGAGGLVSAGIDMLGGGPKYPGPSPEMKEALFFAGENAAEAQALEGPSSRVVGRMTQAGRETVGQQTQQINRMMMGMSPLDAARVTQELMNRSEQQRFTTLDAVKDYAENSRAKQMFNKIQATSAYSDAATRVHQAELQQRVLNLQAQANMDKVFGDAVAGLAKAFGGPALDLDWGGNPFTENMSEDETVDYRGQDLSKTDTRTPEEKGVDETIDLLESMLRWEGK